VGSSPTAPTRQGLKRQRLNTRLVAQTETAAQAANEGYTPMLSPQVTLRSTDLLRLERASLLARYDGGALSSAVFAVIKGLEIEIAWRQHAQHAQHARHHRLACERE
jgi:hypothetical protein